MADLSHISAAILAGGLGTRLRSSVADRPKVLALVQGRPFVTFLLDHLEEAGIRHAVLLTGYMGEMVEETIGPRWGSMRVSYSREQTKLDTGGAVRLALPYLETPQVMVLNGDSFFAADLAGLAGFHREKDAQASLLLTQVDDVSRYGGVDTDQEGRVTAFKEKNSAGGPGWINAGVYLMDREIISSIPAQGAVSLEREVFPAWIGRGLFAQKARGAFLDIGLPETYARAASFFTEVRP